MIDHQNRNRAASMYQTAADHNPSRYSSFGGNGVNYGGFAQAEAARRQNMYANMAGQMANSAALNEQNAMYDRQMRLAEQEQANRHAQAMAQSSAGANEAAIKANALRGMMGGVGNLGSINVQTPSTNLYDNNGSRIGGSYFRSALLG